MAPPLRRDKQRNPVVLALAAGVLFGLAVAVVNMRRDSTSTAAATAAALDDPEAVRQHLTELSAQLKEARAERDAARRDLADAIQRSKDLETKLNTASKTTMSTPSTSGDETCADRHTPWAPSPERDALHPKLAEVLRSVAVNNEVLVAVSNANYAWPGGMLELWMKGVKRAGVKNALVVALDDDTKTNVEKYGLPAYRLDMAIPESQKDSGSNHAVSALKFRILRPFLELGYGVLLSDVDILTLMNPFDHLVRDCDVESLSDGWDEGTAYGYNDVADDPSMGWARYAHSMRIFVFNSGLFYLRPTRAALDLLDKVIYRVESEAGWDQALFNECIFFPNSPKNTDPSVTRRAMDITKFLNSKFLFKYLRHDPGRMAAVKPVMLHVNYHPEKYERMVSAWEYYVDGNKTALDKWADGSMDTVQPQGRRTLLAAELTGAAT